MDSIELNTRISSIAKGSAILMFSAGKDSIASYYQLKQYFPRIELVYQYLHPNLKFINDGLAYFEDKFNQEIHRIPHIGLYRMINENVLQTPEMSDIVEALDLPDHQYKDYYKWLREDLNLPDAWIATGVRLNDSPTRRMSIMVNGAISKHLKSFYPIFDWSNDQIRSCIKDNDIKLTVDYEMFGKSFDGVDYRFIKPIKDRFPDDYERLKEIFPLLDLEILRYEI